LAGVPAEIEYKSLWDAPPKGRTTLAAKRQFRNWSEKLMPYNNNFHNQTQGTRPQWRGNFGSGTKKPVKTFQDLEVYQQALAANVFVVNFIVPMPKLPAVENKSPRGRGTVAKRPDNIGSGTLGIGTIIMETLANCACLIPHQIAEAHSFRFGVQKECLILLERVMLNCNKMVVYLDQARDVCQTGIEVEKFEELQKKYLFIRRKVLNLQRSWQKYMNMPKEEKIMGNTRF